MKPKIIVILLLLLTVCVAAYSYYRNNYVKTLMLSEIVGETDNSAINLAINLFDFDTELTRHDISKLRENKDYWISRIKEVDTIQNADQKQQAIRALYNMAIERKIIKEGTYPFSIYKVSKLKGKGLKRALNMEDVKKIVDMDLSEYPNLVNSCNCFVFSFYTRGMNFADMMKLKWTDISDDQIHYTRSKTKGNFIIKILPPVQKVLDYFKTDTTTKYIFPILSKDKLSPTQLEYRKKKMLLLYNKQLKEISKVCGINKPISSYVARHSFANCLKQKGVATDIISESMGHQNLTGTQAYLKELESSVLDNACEMLL